jgi:RHS repeat-associated protein
MLSDHLGSTSTTANADGSWNSSISYTAFGEIRASSGITARDFRYTGQLRQAELGLYYYVARWYDPQLAHFTQADTVVPNAGDAASYDLYTYVRNNPVRFSDPSGHKPYNESTDGQSITETGWHVKPTDFGSFLYWFTSTTTKGETCKTTMENIYKKTEKVPFFLYTKGNYHDTGFKKEFRDPWPNSNNQVGHFITAVKFGEYSIKSTGWKETALDFVIGHEMLADGFPILSNIQQVLTGRRYRETHEMFLSGKDSEFTKILEITGTEKRSGNSIQDLRLSYKGWEFAQLIYGDELQTNEEYAAWLAQNIGE